MKKLILTAACGGLSLFQLGYGACAAYAQGSNYPQSQRQAMQGRPASPQSAYNQQDPTMQSDYRSGSGVTSSYRTDMPMQDPTLQSTYRPGPGGATNPYGMQDPTMQQQPPYRTDSSAMMRPSDRAMAPSNQSYASVPNYYLTSPSQPGAYYYVQGPYYQGSGATMGPTTQFQSSYNQGGQYPSAYYFQGGPTSGPYMRDPGYQTDYNSSQYRSDMYNPTMDPRARMNLSPRTPRSNALQKAPNQGFPNYPTTTTPSSRY